MNDRRLAFLVTAGLISLSLACKPASDATVQKTEQTTKTADGSTVKTSSETTQVGSTVESKTETKVDTPSGDFKAKTETYIGTVTEYTAGKKIQIISGDKNNHSWSLDDKDVVYSIKGAVAVGNHVTVVDETGDNKVRTLTITPGA